MNNKYVWPSILIFLLFLIPGCLEDNSDEPWFDYNWFHYDVELKTNSTDSFILYLPVTIASRISSPLQGKPNAIMNELEIISGNIDYRIENVSIGYILNVTGTGPFRIEFYKYIDKSKTDEELDRDYQFGNISTDDGSYGQTKVFFFTTSNDSFYLSYDIYNVREHSYGGHHNQWATINYKLSNGWNNITDYREHCIVG